MTTQTRPAPLPVLLDAYRRKSGPDAEVYAVHIAERLVEHDVFGRLEAIRRDLAEAVAGGDDLDLAAHLALNALTDLLNSED